MKKSINRRSTLLLIFLLSAISFGLFLSCDTTPPNNGDSKQVQVTIEEIPEALPVGIDLFFPIVVNISESVGEAFDSIYCHIYDPSGGDYLVFTLYDDGSAFDHPPESDLLSLRSGDIVPGDGRFTRQINGKNFQDDFGIYIFEFRPFAISGYLGSAEDSIDIQPVEAPSFISITPVISEFPAGFDPVEYEVHIQKPTASDRIDSVYLALWYSGIPTSDLRHIPFTASLGDTVWTLNLTPGHFWGIPSGLYDFQFVLWDRFGLEVDTAQRFIGITNGPPIVSNPVMPDTIWRPLQGEPNDTTVITVQADDPETLQDIATVRFEVRKAWQTEWTGHEDFYLLDLGGRWDDVEGDGVYSVPLVTAFSDSLKDNLFYFRFYAIDFTQNASNYVIDSVRVIEP